MTSLSLEYRERILSPKDRQRIPRIREDVTVMRKELFMIGAILSFFPAPKFWLRNERLVWARQLLTVYMKPSTLLAAVLPATAREPKELTEDWISTLETLNTTDWRPAGTPI